jgi:glycosyltransferase involved in cell wall biosynthesis
MKKIIFVHLLNDFSGSPKVLSQVIESAQNNGRDIELYTGKSSSGFLSNLTKKHHFYFYKRFENKYFTLVTFLLSQTILFFKLLKYFNKDIVIYVNTMLPFGAGLAGWVMKKPVYYHIHETYLSPTSLKYFLRSIIKISTTKIIFVSESVKELESFQNKEQLVIYNSVPQDFVINADKKDYIDKNKSGFNVLMISSLKSYKGVNEFIALAQLLLSNSDITFTLVLNAEKSEIDNYFSNFKFPSNIALFPQQSNVFEFYAKSNLLLNLSKIDECVETFGLTIIEAMSFGVPVIVPPVGGPTELVRAGVEGYLISSYKVDEIAQKIMKLSKDEKEYLRLSKNAKKRSLDFNENVFQTKILKLLNA